MFAEAVAEVVFDRRFVRHEPLSVSWGVNNYFLGKRVSGGQLTGCCSASAAVSRFEESGLRRSRMKFFADAIGGEVIISWVTGVQHTL